MKPHTLIAIGLIPFGCLLLAAQTSSSISPKDPPKPATQATTQAAPKTDSDNPGERKFRQNCSRCHSAPDELSPRISGTVLMHMRVRASLSAKDERDILRYLAP